jgi:integrase
MWSDIDLDNRFIKLTKTKNNTMRIIPINDTLYQVLCALRSHNCSGHVFLFNGKPVKSVKTSFNKALKRAGVDDFHFHDLRHTFASYLTMNGVVPQVTQQLLGHSSLQMTSRYMNLSDNYARNAVDMLDRKIEKDTNLKKDNTSQM